MIALFCLASAAALMAPEQPSSSEDRRPSAVAQPPSKNRPPLGELAALPLEGHADSVGGATFQENPSPRFRVAVSAVQVDVFVGRKGRAVLGLTKDDFALFDNGVRQRIELVDVDETPLSVALVLDTSDSVAGVRLLHLQAAAHSFLNGLAEADRASLITFSHHIDQRTELTSDIRALHDSIDRAEARGATAWHDALYAGLKVVEPVTQRAIVLLFTDGEDTYSWLRPEQLTPLVEQSNAVLYAVKRQDETINIPGNPSTSAWRRAWREARHERSRRTRLLRELTEATGGRLIETPSTAQLEEVFLQVLAEMKTRYLLTYRPSSIENGWHDVEVKLNGVTGDVSARRGYFYEGSE